MTQLYKRERQRGWEMDQNRNRKLLNSSERQSVKREISSELDTFQKEYNTQNLRTEIEDQFTKTCFHAEESAKRNGIFYKCECPIVNDWNLEKLRKHLGL